MGGSPVHYCMFVVDESPYCVWDWDLQGRTTLFLEGVDPDYFVYLADIHTKLEEGEEQYAALALRTAYSQALETLFAFIGASLQAPLCVPAWLAKYQNKELDRLIDKIHRGSPINSRVGYRAFSWNEISEEFHAGLVLEDKEKERRIKQQFGQLWRQFADDFLDEDRDREYNNIKHGFRVKPGGYFFALGLEEQPGVPAPPENMRTIGQSDYGSSFLVQEPVSEDKSLKHHFQLKRKRLNWSPQDMIVGLHLVAMSLKNIIAHLQIVNGIDAEKVQFWWLKSEEEYRQLWSNRNFGMLFQRVDPPITDEMIKKFTKEQILTAYKSGASE